ncbi:MAG: roadblock/LC7 domain-containing protein [Candidatus Lokiarchaeota archaeon]|nr:roadblock/LC7 domain-containing protein [Candidatus Lokiarchaeota archaeon]
MSEIGLVLESLKSIKGVHGAALIEKFGLIKGSAVPGWIDPDAVAAMVTLILKASQRATKELEQGKFNNAIIECENGKILFSEIKGNILCIITTVDAKLGIINLKLHAASKSLESKL